MHFFHGSGGDDYASVENMDPEAFEVVKSPDYTSYTDVTKGIIPGLLFKFVNP